MFNLKNAIIPTPVKIEDKGGCVKIGEVSSPAFSLCFKGEGEVFSEAVSYLRKKLCSKTACMDFQGDYEITLSVDNSVQGGKSEAYTIDITDKKATLTGSDEAGAYYAAVSFVKLLHLDKTDLLLPLCHISDYPRFSKRGHFMECRYGSDFMTCEDWKKGIDYLSEMKINKIVYGLYGCWGRQYDGDFAEYLYIPFKKYPQLKTPRNIKYYSAKERCMIYKKDVLPTMFEDDYFGEIAEYGKRKNVKVVPLFNSLGHNTLIPRLFPEISAVGEDGSYQSVGFCTNNDKTYEIMFDIYDEIIDRYLTPNSIDSFVIGLDEVWNMLGINPDNHQEERSPFCQCEKCKGKDYGDLMLDYIIKITKHLKEKGMKNVYVYHDMLFKFGKLSEETVELFKKESVYDTIVIDWWSYRADPELLFTKRMNEVNGLFRSVGKPITGYFHWALPTQMNENIYLITSLSEKLGFEGLIAYSAFEYCYDFNYLVYAECAWRGNEALPLDKMLSNYAALNFPENHSAALSALRDMQEFMFGRYSGTNHASSVFEYYVSTYLYRDTEYPVNYPANVFKKLCDDEEKYLDYFRNVCTKAKSAYDFFDKKTSSNAGDIWKLTALQYFSLCDEFYTVYTCAKSYSEGNIDESVFVSELSRLISQREKTISLCEDVRIPANQYTSIRNMTVALQWLSDLRDYMKEEIKSGRKPEVDLLGFDKYLSKKSWFLR